MKEKREFEIEVKEIDLKKRRRDYKIGMFVIIALTLSIALNVLIAIGRKEIFSINTVTAFSCSIAFIMVVRDLLRMRKFDEFIKKTFENVGLKF